MLKYDNMSSGLQIFQAVCRLGFRLVPSSPGITVTGSTCMGSVGQNSDFVESGAALTSEMQLWVRITFGLEGWVQLQQPNSKHEVLPECG